MRTIETNNPLVITNPEIDLVTELIESGMMVGASYDQDKSLFEFGFVYDSKTELCIVTKKMHTWPHIKEPLVFRVGQISMHDIYAQFQLNQSKILAMKNGQSIIDWMEMCDAYKLKDIEDFNLFLTKSLSKIVLFDELIEILDGHIEKNYKHLML